jgi:Peptidoglycan-binding protein, CsiV
MTSATLRRLALLLVLALAAPSAALAQGRTGQETPPHATSAAPPRAPAAQATGGQAPPATAAKPAATIAPNAPAATAPAATAAAAAAPAYTGPAYDIEIVIFRAKVALGQPENWAAETTASATVAGGEAASSAGTVGKLLSVLPSSDYRLTPVVAQLRSSGTYVPVAHAAWLQTASAWGTRAGFSLQSLGINVPGLSGVIFLERGEFLHLGMTLDYTMQNPPPGLNAPPGTTFVMNETRRVRFYQRNYYDHPAFGVIALITPARGPRPPGR